MILKVKLFKVNFLSKTQAGIPFVLSGFGFAFGALFFHMLELFETIAI